VIVAEEVKLGVVDGVAVVALDLTVGVLEGVRVTLAVDALVAVNVGVLVAARDAVGVMEPFGQGAGEVPSFWTAFVAPPT
jgi:hypothetical protein